MAFTLGSLNLSSDAKNSVIGASIGKANAKSGDDGTLAVALNADGTPAVDSESKKTNEKGEVIEGETGKEKSKNPLVIDTGTQSVSANKKSTADAVQKILKPTRFGDIAADINNPNKSTPANTETNQTGRTGNAVRDSANNIQRPLTSIGREDAVGSSSGQTSRIMDAFKDQDGLQNQLATNSAAERFNIPTPGDSQSSTAGAGANQLAFNSPAQGALAGGQRGGPGPVINSGNTNIIGNNFGVNQVGPNNITVNNSPVSIREEVPSPPPDNGGGNDELQRLLQDSQSTDYGTSEEGT